MKSPLLLLFAVAPVVGFAAGWLTRPAGELQLSEFQPEPSRASTALPEPPPLPRGLVLEQALRLSDTLELQAATARTVLEMNLDEVEASIARLAKATMDQDVIRTLAHLFRRYGELDGARALAAAESFPIPSRRSGLINSALRGLAYADPYAAWQAGAERDRLAPVAEVLRQTGHLDFLFSQFVALPEGRQKTQVSGGLAYYFSRYEPDSLVPIIDSLPPGASRTQFVTAFAAEWAAVDPAAAVEWVRGLGPQESAQPLDAVIFSWTRNSPESLVAWLQEQPAGPGLDGILQRTFMLSSTFPEAMLQIAEKVTDSWQREQLRRSVIANVARQEPERAAPLAETVTDPATRRQMLMTVMNRWREMDKVSAQNYIVTSSNLTPEERSLLQSVLDRPATPPGTRPEPGPGPVIIFGP